ncbi:putative Interleukin-like EMT inducer-containing protein, partial [Homarus americanus]
MMCGTLTCVVSAVVCGIQSCVVSDMVCDSLTCVVSDVLCGTLSPECHTGLDEGCCWGFFSSLFLHPPSCRIFRSPSHRVFPSLQVYEKEDSSTQMFLSHSGIHLLVLHPTRGDVMLAMQFLTHQPAEHRNLAACLRTLMPGRLLVVAAVPDAATFLAEDAVLGLEAMGASRIRNLAAFEAWAIVTHTPTSTHTPSLRDYMPSHSYTSSNNRSNNSTGPSRHPQEETSPSQEVSRGRVWGEAVTTIRRPDGIFGYPLSMDTRVPKVS